MRLSTSRKNKQSGEYEQDFSGYCLFIGKAHEVAQTLKEKDRIKILDCEVTTDYVKEQNKEYVNYKVFACEKLEKSGAAAPHTSGSPTSTEQKPVTGKQPALLEDDDDNPF